MLTSIKQKKFWHTITKIVHGEEEAEKAQTAARALFVQGGKTADIPTTSYPAAELEEGKDILTLLVDTKLAKNRSEARRLVTQGGVSVNDVKVTDFAKVFTSADFDEDGVLLIKKGKKGYHQIKADFRDGTNTETFILYKWSGSYGGIRLGKVP